jgi:protein TonB
MLILTMLLAMAAETPPPTPNTLIVPDWRRKATGADLMKVYPSRALRRGVSGAAIVGCSVSAEGEMTDCRVIEEAPVGEGFGDAALKLMPRFLMRPATRGGIPVEGGWVRIPIRFSPPQ